MTIFWYRLILLPLLLFIQFSSTENGFKKEILISCVSNFFAEELTNFHFKYDETMAEYNFKFHDGEIDLIKGMLGNRNKIIFFFLGNQDRLRNLSGRHFYSARDQLWDTGACVCVVSYDISAGCSLLSDFKYFTILKNRTPRVVEMATSFIQNIIDSSEFPINLSTVYLSGYCLGGHIAGNVGLALKKIYNGQMVPTIWAFDPPWLGFTNEIEDGNPRRVQKGDARCVVIFHTSWIGIKETIGDIDVMLNDGNKIQPGCKFLENPDISFKCSHQAAFTLRELIIKKSDKLPLNEGIPFATAHNSDQCPLAFTNMPLNKTGTYYLRTGKIFGTKFNLVVDLTSVSN
ncbi:uncharacterized protein LOC116344236 [Contarinia nasturtii]|uniref:uncharacterized protein LOC116344236 n=1 Tax=Contarinia nasturtii TaxID=265458 RepID=UPI0012D3C060|nr:uncharacterized protein LOC116344236 [Contarinia nasturtii]